MLPGLRDVGPPKRSRPGQYKSPGKVVTPGGVADQIRRNVIDRPVLLVAVGYLYHKTFVRDTDRSSGWGTLPLKLTDVLAVTIITMVVSRFTAASRRWF